MSDEKETNWFAIGGAVAGVAVVAVVGGMCWKYFFGGSAKKYLQGPELKLPITLVDKETISPDTILYTFRFPSPDYVLGLPVGNHVRIHARINGRDEFRSYTPVSLDELEGYVKFIIKTYRKNVHPSFPNGGVMTQYLEGLEVGDGVDVSGPLGQTHYAGNGQFEIGINNPRTLKVKYVNMLCGGSGLTPMYQILLNIINSPGDDTKVALIFANRTEDDILMREDIDKLARENAGQVRVYYTVESPPPGWVYGIGYLDGGMLEQHAYPAGDETLNLVCGPPPMVKNACLPNLTAAGHKKDSIVVF